MSDAPNRDDLGLNNLSGVARRLELTIGRWPVCRQLERGEVIIEHLAQIFIGRSPIGISERCLVAANLNRDTQVLKNVSQLALNCATKSKRAAVSWGK